LENGRDRTKTGLEDPKEDSKGEKNE